MWLFHNHGSFFGPIHDHPSVLFLDIPPPKFGKSNPTVGCIGSSPSRTGNGATPAFTRLSAESLAAGEPAVAVLMDRGGLSDGPIGLWFRMVQGIAIFNGKKDDPFSDKSII